MKLRKAMSILVTAGPTREKIDPIRFISNYSSGLFGYEIAKEARRRGHRVFLISGPTALEAPQGIKLIRVESALEMGKAVKKLSRKADCVIMAAAVSDWRIERAFRNKIKRGRAASTLKLVENPDILYGLGKRRKKGRILVGFALETENLAKNALKKLKKKNLDLIVANRQYKAGDVFGDKYIDILIMDKLGNRTAYRRKSKRVLAKIVLDRALNFRL